MYLILFALWLLFNGRVTWEIVFFGLGVSALCYAAACMLFGFSVKKDLALAKKAGGMARLLCRLWLEIMKANAATLRVIYGKKQPKPVFVTFDTPVHDPAAQAALANCVTLTPGTITAEISDGKMTVHCLDESFSEGLAENALVRTLQGLEGGKPRHDL